MGAVAFVTADHQGLSIASGQWSRVHEPVGVPFVIVDQAAGARAWLRAQIDKSAANPASG